MKITESIQQYYDNQLGLNKKLKNMVDEIIGVNKKDTWHYDSRIKTLESYALKVETGRIEDPNKLDDFFACTIVVKNYNEIRIATKEIINGFFTVKCKKPHQADFTHKSPYSFPYDDLRFYVQLKPREDLPPEHAYYKLSGILFEIQIRTFLQHAWTSAAHDLVYKSDEISWAKQRIAYQIKAVLEQAEISIDMIENIKQSAILSKSDKKTICLNKVKKFMTDNWESEALPKDLIRLADNVNSLLAELGITVTKLQKFLDEESQCGRGTKTLNLSPYFTIIQTIINQEPQKINNWLAKNSMYKIIIPPEIDANGIPLNDCKIIRI